MEAIKISMSALNVEWQRLQIIADNLANLNSVNSVEGDIFHSRQLVSGPSVSFDQLLTVDGVGALGVQVKDIVETTGNGKRSYEPEHPHADEMGFVTYADVDHAGEMTRMIKTSRAYEANLTSFSIAQQMYQSAINMGRS